jgi:hypothetical protein
MVTILYTNSDAVRAALGIETDDLQKELPDHMFVNQNMERQLRAALYAWLPTYASIVAAADAVDPDESGDTDFATLYQGDLVRNYCLFWAAWRAAEMAYFARRKVSDGRSEVERFSIDWEALADRMKSRAEEQQSLLQATFTPSLLTVFAKRSIPDYDPVANI